MTAGARVDAPVTLPPSPLVLPAPVEPDRLDRILSLARAYFEVPLAAINVLEGDGACAVRASGFPPGTTGRRRDTFCDWTQALGEAVLVPDALNDPDFARLGSVRELGVRFYAGHPLRDGQGNVVASLCIFDLEPRTLDATQRATFRDLAEWAQQELVAATELSRAGQIQASMLPRAPIRTREWQVDGTCLPSLAVGGDFYDFGLEQDVIHVTLGDVMGKGTGAALLGAGMRSTVRSTRSAVSAGVDLGVTVTDVGRRQLPDLERAESFVTLFEAAIDLDDGYLRYVDAGLGLCLVVRGDGTVDQLSSQDRPLGVLPDDHWTELDEVLDPGDRLLLFSDGLLDLLDDQDRWLDELGALVADADDVGSLMATLRERAATRTASDDVTAVAVFRGVPGRAPTGGAA
ncbi:PP2C family protein-serine/threonine phosphatase [Nocardioides sp. GCM10027113]|uniref:PP2C family protein-serine/threonine phosphatase n=1 Tax=unclassified Nocardioides TaxID=2615069 RepID=UPI00361A4A18